MGIAFATLLGVAIGGTLVCAWGAPRNDEARGDYLIATVALFVVWVVAAWLGVL